MAIEPELIDEGNDFGCRYWFKDQNGVLLAVSDVLAASYSLFYEDGTIVGSKENVAIAAVDIVDDVEHATLGFGASTLIPMDRDDHIISPRTKTEGEKRLLTVKTLYNSSEFGTSKVCERRLEYQLRFIPGADTAVPAAP